MSIEERNVGSVEKPVSVHQSRKRPSKADSSAPKKKARGREGSDDGDTDAELTSSKRYVRPSPKPCPRSSPISRKESVLVFIPSPTIDKSLYLPYSPSSHHEQLVADSDVDESPSASSHGDEDQQLTPETAQQPQTTSLSSCNVPLPSLLNGSDRRPRDRSVKSYTLYHPIFSGIAIDLTMA